MESRHPVISPSLPSPSSPAFQAQAVCPAIASPWVSLFGADFGAEVSCNPSSTAEQPSQLSAKKREIKLDRKSQEELTQSSWDSDLEWFAQESKTEREVRLFRDEEEYSQPFAERRELAEIEPKEECQRMFGEYKDSFREFNNGYWAIKGKMYEVNMQSKNSKHVLNYPDLYMSKMVYMDDSRVFVIGGANMRNLESPTDKVIEFKMPDLTPVSKKTMLTKRSSFGCTLSKERKTIFVLGGYSKSYHTIDKWELYDIKSNVQLISKIWKCFLFLFNFAFYDNKLKYKI